MLSRRHSHRAPKVRAMEIIEEVEPVRRGIYGGPVLYADFAGNLDSCIAIRTMLVKGKKAYVQADAGIVADSPRKRASGMSEQGPGAGAGGGVGKVRGVEGDCRIAKIESPHSSGAKSAALKLLAAAPETWLPS